MLVDLRCFDFEGMGGRGEIDGIFKASKVRCLKSCLRKCWFFPTSLTRVTRAFRRPFAKPQSCDASSMLGPLQVVVGYLKHELVRCFQRFVAHRDLHGKSRAVQLGTTAAIKGMP